MGGLLQKTKMSNKAQNKNHNTKQRVVVLQVLLQPYSFPLHINKHWKVSSHAHHNKTDRAAPYSVRFHLQQKLYRHLFQKALAGSTTYRADSVPNDDAHYKYCAVFVTVLPAKV